MNPAILMHSMGRVCAILLVCLSVAACVSSDNADDGLELGEETGVASAARTGSGEDEIKLRRVPALPAPRPAADGSQILISESDILEVDVYQVDELDRIVQVDSRGMITMPLIGEISAAGQSPGALATSIATLYGRDYLQSPQVTVFLKESYGQRVTIDGEVRQAGIYPTTSTSSLMGVLAQAGGLNQIADKSKIFVFRDFEGEKLVANYNLNKIRKGTDSDPKIYGRDVVVVFPSGSRVAARNLREVLGLARSATPFVP